MLIKTIINEKYREIELHVCKDCRDEETARIVQDLHALYDPAISGTDEQGNRCLLSTGNILTFYAEQQRVYAVDHSGRYVVAKTLQEIEREFAGQGFIRISRSEIVSIKKIKGLDLGMTGTIRVILQNGYETYTSRRNVSRLKEALERINGRER